MSAFTFIWLGIEAVGLIDALLHTAPDWHYADRDRWFWVIFMFVLGPIFVVPYFLMVRPRFPSRVSKEQANPFSKR